MQRLASNDALHFRCLRIELYIGAAIEYICIGALASEVDVHFPPIAGMRKHTRCEALHVQYSFTSSFTIAHFDLMFMQIDPEHMVTPDALLHSNREAAIPLAREVPKRPAGDW